MVIVGGAGYFFGPFLGAAVVILLPEFLRFTGGYYLIIYAVLVIVMLVFVPSGLIGIWARIREQFIARPVARADLQQGAPLK
jgi:branched-chain amino acid transport system permease protein